MTEHEANNDSSDEATSQPVDGESGDTARGDLAESTPTEPSGHESELPIHAIDETLADEAIEQYAADFGPGPADDTVSPPRDQASSNRVGGAPPCPDAPPLGSGSEHHSPPPSYRRLFRSRSDRKLGGVAGGLANYLGIDPTLVRVAFVVLALTGVTVLVYLAAWIIVPEHPANYAEQVWVKPGGTDRHVAIAVGVGSLGLAVAILSGTWTLLAFALIAGGIWLLTQQDDGRASSPHASAPSAYEPAPGPQSATAGPGPSGWVETPVPSPAGGQQRVTRVVVSLLALLVALGVAASTGNWWDVDATRLFGIGIVMIGLGVVTGAVTRHGSRWLIPLGIIGLVLLAPVAVVEGVVRDGVGESTHRPNTLAQLDNTYLHGIGEMTVDLRNVDLEGETRHVDIKLGIGDLVVLVSEDQGGSARLVADVGDLSIDFPGGSADISTDGLDVSTGSVRLPGDQGTLQLDIDLGLGAARLEID